MRMNNKRIRCADGFTMSVQASSTSYCEPHQDTDLYTSAEVGFPSAYDFFLHPYAEDSSAPTKTVYGYVPAAVIRLCIESHGGMVDGELPKFAASAWDGDRSGED